MPFGLLSLLVSVLNVDLSHAIPDHIASRTIFPPTATLGPDLIAEPTPFKNLSKRADHIPPNFCGWFSGSDYGMCALFIISAYVSQDPRLMRFILPRWQMDICWSFNNLFLEQRRQICWQCLSTTDGMFRGIRMEHLVLHWDRVFFASRSVVIWSHPTHFISKRQLI